MITNRNLRSDNIGQPVEIDLSYDIGAAGVPTARIGSSKWVITRVTAGVYRLTFNKALGKPAVSHIVHSGFISHSLASTSDIRLVPVTDSWSQVGAFLEFRAVTGTGVASTVATAEIPTGSRMHLRIKQEYVRVNKR